MNTVRLEKFGPIISDKDVGSEILQLIHKELESGKSVQLDLNGIKTMATFCSKQIFGSLYLTLGPEAFFDRIKILNASDDIRLLIRIGIQNALEDGVNV